MENTEAQVPTNDDNKQEQEIVDDKQVEIEKSEEQQESESNETASYMEEFNQLKAHISELKNSMENLKQSISSISLQGGNAIHESTNKDTQEKVCEPYKTLEELDYS